jgi:hypothetical protein
LTATVARRFKPVRKQLPGSMLPANGALPAFTRSGVHAFGHLGEAAGGSPRHAQHGGGWPRMVGQRIREVKE